MIVIEPYYRPARCLQIGHDEPESWELHSGMMLNLRHYSPRRRPTGGLVEKALVPLDRSVTGTPRRTLLQFRHIAFQVLVGRDVDGVLHARLFQRIKNRRLD